MAFDLLNDGEIRKMRRDQIDYWLNPTPENLPHEYLKDAGRSKMLVDVIKHKIGLEHDRTILEVGCNVGRNLRYLDKAGYTQLAGVDVNPKALELAKVECCYMLGAIEEVLPRIKQPYGLVFTMAVLQHIPPENDSVFEHVARLGKYNLLVIEDEISHHGTRHFPRNYKDVFEGHGMTQIKGWRNLRDLSKRFVMRWFRGIYHA